MSVGKRKSGFHLPAALVTVLFCGGNGIVSAEQAPAPDAPAPSPPRPAPLSAADIVRRTIDVMEQKPTQLICRVVSERAITDGDGNVSEHERAEIEETRSGDRIHWKVMRKWKNGRDVTAQALAEERRRED